MKGVKLKRGALIRPRKRKGDVKMLKLMEKLKKRKSGKNKKSEN